jgi:hypothetical protein
VRRWRWLIGAAATFIVATTLFYLVPGLPDSPHGTHTHDLAHALAEAALITLLSGAMAWFVFLRRT